MYVVKRINRKKRITVENILDMVDGYMSDYEEVEFNPQQQVKFSSFTECLCILQTRYLVTDSSSSNIPNLKETQLPHD